MKEVSCYENESKIVDTDKKNDESKDKENLNHLYIFDAFDLTKYFNITSYIVINCCMGLMRLFNTYNGKILLSVILGLGLTGIFKKVCSMAMKTYCFERSFPK